MNCSSNSLLSRYFYVYFKCCVCGRHLSICDFSYFLFIFTVSGEVPEEPIVSNKSGLLFEKRLIERHISVFFIFCSSSSVFCTVWFFRKTDQMENASLIFWFSFLVHGCAAFASNGYNLKGRNGFSSFC